MEVSRANFAQVLPQVLADISAASCIAIDTELTGLTTESALRPHAFDTIDSRYACLRNAAKFGILQYGVCPFIADPVTGAFVAKPYTFLTLPRVSAIGSDNGKSGWGGDTILALSTSAVEFLSRNALDFNAVAARGLTFLSREGEAALRQQRRAEAVAKIARSIADTEDDAAAVASSASSPAKPRVLCQDAAAATATDTPAAAPGDLVISRPADVEWFRSLTRDVHAWLESAVTDTSGSFPFMLLPKANGFRRRAVHTWVQSELAGSLVVSSRPEDQAGADDFAKVQRLTYVGAGTPGRAAWARSEMQRAVDLVDAAVDSAVEFRRVIDAITASGVPVIGHNAFLDFVHTTTKFVGDAPPNVTQWAAQLALVFPTVYDTKVVCAAPELVGVFAGGSSLGQVYEAATAKSAIASVDIASSADSPGGDPSAPQYAGAKRTRPAGDSGVTGSGTEPTGPSAVLAPAATTAAAPAADNRRISGGGAGGWRASRPERTTFSVDVEALVEVRLAPGFSFHREVSVQESPPVASPKASPADATAAASAHAAGLAPPATSMDLVAADSCAHNAGADAYMTGVAFLRMAALISADATACAVAAAVAPPGVEPAASPGAPSAWFPPRSLRLPRISATALHSALQQVIGRDVSGSADSGGASQPLPALGRLADSLFLMRVTAPDHRVLRLRDARALARAGRPRASRTQLPEDVGNAVLTARMGSQLRGNSLVHVSGLTPAISASALQALVTGALGISRHLVDKWKHICYVDDNSGFVLLPSAAHVNALLAAAASDAAASDSSGERAEANMRDAGEGVFDGDNMLGLPGAFAGHLMRDDSAVGAAPSPAASTAPSQDVWVGLPRHIAALLPRPLRLADFHWQSYKAYLSSRTDVFGAECDHEVAELAPPPMLLPNSSGGATAVEEATPGSGVKCSVT